MYFAWPGDYHSLSLTRIQIHPAKVTPLTNLDEVTAQGLCYCNPNTWGCHNQGIWDVSKEYLPELLERVSAGKAQEVAGILSICVNFTVFSFVMVYNNKKVCAIFGCHITFVSKPRTFNSSNFRYSEIFGFNRIDFMCFGILEFIQYSTKKL